MNVSELVKELTAAIGQQKDQLANLATKKARLKELKSQCSGLKINAQFKYGAISDALEPNDVDTAKKEHADALDRIESHNNAIENLTRYINEDEVGKQVRKEISDLKIQLLQQRYADLVEELELSDEQLKLMKEFVVISKIAQANDPSGYGVGELASMKYGEVTGDDWQEVKKQSLLAMGLSETMIQNLH